MVNIQLEWTPNPSTLKYVVDRQLLPSGAVNFTDREKAASLSPLATKLFGITGVAGVMVGTNFVTVTKGEQGEWDELNDGVMQALDAHLSSDEPVMSPDWAPPAVAAGGEVEQRIRDLLDAEIRPAVAQDGGDVTLDRFEGGVAYLHMQGSCAGCPSSTMTLKMGIETRLRELIPEVQEVVPV
jgi:Fe-S cluster biogenesis protein NfuA